LLNRPIQNTKRILIADDDPVILDIVQVLVECEGYDVVTALDGRDAYRILHKDSDFRAVILDMVMPHLEGSDLLHQMQTEKRLSRIPVIIMSSSDDFKVLSQGIGAGAVAFIPKPFTPDQMRNVLRLVTLRDHPSRNLSLFPVNPGTILKPAAKPVRVLLIEDNPGEAFVIKSTLLKAAAKTPHLSTIEISRAELLSGGIEQVLAGEVDVVLLDLSLPDSEGLSTLTTLLEQYAGVPIVVLTGSDDATLASEAIKLGAKGYLVKGQVDEPAMIRAVRDAFESKQANAHLYQVMS
jgi:DNA-binding response OmpR family regulator